MSVRVECFEGDLGRWVGDCGGKGDRRCFIRDGELCVV